MLLVLIVYLLGIWRYRIPGYWKWAMILTAWHLVMPILFYAGGTLENPDGDGLLTRYIRAATADGIGMGVFAIMFVILFWGFSLFCILRMRRAVRARNEEIEDVERDFDEAPASRKALETIGLLVICAGWIYWQYNQAFSARDKRASYVHPIENEKSDLQQDRDPIAENLKDAAAQITATSPTKVDPITILERASAEGRILTYHYRITRRDASDEAIIAFVKKSNFPKLCSKPDTRKEFDDYGITYRYSYTLPNRSKPVTVDANSKACRELTG